MKRVMLLTSGGTISSLVDPATGAASPAVSGAELANMLPLTADISIEVVEIARVGGSQMTPSIGMAIFRRIRQALEERAADGFVITQGTDSVEEIGFLLDTLIETEHPIVHTASMRSHSDLGADTIANLYTAIRVAASEEARGHGVLVVMNDMIFAASEVIKSDTVNVNSFMAPGRGPLGVVTRHKPVFFHKCLTRIHIPTEKLEEKVACIRICLGMNGVGILAAVADGARGIVLEGNGAGNIAESAFDAILEAIRSGVVVVMTSSCYSGLIDDIYGYPAGGYTLRQNGIIFAQGLTPPKARIKLMAALSAYSDIASIKQAFEYLF